MLNDNKETKICKKCGRELQLDRYQLYKSTGYRRIICKDCLNKDMRENRLQKRITTGLEQYSKEKSMKIQRRFKKPYLFQKLDKTESGTPPSLRDTSPIFCYAKHRGGGLIPFCHIILSKEKDCIYTYPLPCPVALRGVALAIGEIPF